MDNNKLNPLQEKLEQLNKNRVEKLFKEKILSDENLDTMEERMMPINRMLSYYRCAAMEVETKFKVLNEQFSLRYDNNPIESVKTRIKSMNSIMKKVVKKDIPLDFDAVEENIRDIAGVRVICSFLEDVYLVADSFLQQDDVTLIEMKDYIKYPKQNGYRSLHLIVEVPIYLEKEKKPMKVEVQIRTLAMDLWASQEHRLRYKKNIPEDVEEEFSNKLSEFAEMLAEMDYQMERLHIQTNSTEYQSELNKSRNRIDEIINFNRFLP